MATKEIKMNVVESFIRANIQHYNADKYWNRRKKVVNAEAGGGDICFIEFSICAVSSTLSVAMHSIMQVWELIWGMAPNLKHHPICRMAYMGL